MYIPAELVLKTYKPLVIEPGMFFTNVLYKGTRKELVELYQLDKHPLNQEQFIEQHGYPVELYIIGEDDFILATPEQIGWWDAGEETDELYDITLKELNTIIQDYDGMLMIDVDEIHTDDESDEYVEVFPIKYLDKVTLCYLHEIEEEDDDEDGLIVCDRCENKWHRFLVNENIDGDNICDHCWDDSRDKDEEGEIDDDTWKEID